MTKCYIHKCNVTHPDEIAVAVKDTVEHYGRIINVGFTHFTISMTEFHLSAYATTPYMPSPRSLVPSGLPFQKLLSILFSRG